MTCKPQHDMASSPEDGKDFFVARKAPRVTLCNLASFAPFFFFLAETSRTGATTGAMADLTSALTRLGEVQQQQAASLQGLESLSEQKLGCIRVHMAQASLSYS